jgi:hypothetical protein
MSIESFAALMTVEVNSDEMPGNYVDGTDLLGNARRIRPE